MVLRIIAGIDVKPPFLVKGVHLEGLKKFGLPDEFARKYYQDGIDEISYQDVVATLFARSGIYDLVEKTASEVFIPITAGGGIDSLQAAQKMLHSGADKISINTAAILKPNLLLEISEKFGLQSVVLRVEARRKGNDWFCMTNSGRENTDVKVLDWISKAGDMGIGELHVLSIDKEGTLSGPDIELFNEVRRNTDLPLIVSGGVVSNQDVLECSLLGVDGVVLNSALLMNKINILELKAYLKHENVMVRE